MLPGSKMNGCPKRTWNRSSGWRSPSCQQRPRCYSTNSFARHTATLHRHRQLRKQLQLLKYQLAYYQPDTARLPACSTTCSLRKRQNVPTAVLLTFRSSIKKMKIKWKSPVPGNGRWVVDTEGTHSGLVDDRLIIRCRLELLLKLSNVFWQVLNRTALEEIVWMVRQMLILRTAATLRIAKDGSRLLVSMFR